MPKIALISTGGTIASRPRAEATSLGLSGQDILSSIPNYKELADIEIHDFGMFGSSQITLQQMHDLFQLIAQLTDRSDIEGVVVTHGTDSMEESAFFCNCLYEGIKPVVFTGSMKTSADLGWDGPGNLLDAICTAIHPLSQNKGVLVVMASQIHTAKDVTKMHAQSLETFQSGDVGPLGVLDKGQVIYYRTHHHIPTLALAGGLTKGETLKPTVALIKTVTDMDDSLIRYCHQQKYQGIVIEGMGRGNMPRPLANAAIQATQEGMEVVICTRCPQGRVYGNHISKDAGHKAWGGLISAGKLNGPKARLQLILALKAGLSRDEIRHLFSDD